jgi:hypothetical protein
MEVGLMYSRGVEACDSGILSFKCCCFKSSNTLRYCTYKAASITSSHNGIFRLEDNVYDPFIA